MVAKVLKILAIIILIITVVILINAKKVIRLYKVNTLFNQENIVANFQGMNKIFDVSQIKASKKPLVLGSNISYTLPATFKFQNEEFSVEQYLKESNTEGLMIIQNDTIIYENYNLGLERHSAHISWSMAKSFISTLMGCMVESGRIDLEKSVTDYLPQFVGTGYEDVRIKDVLQMSSGVRFNEDYADFNSDINRFGRAFALGSSLESFSKSLKKERESGTYNQYVSIDTQVLGLLIAKVSGRTLTDLTQELIWEPLGMQDPAYWIIDKTGFEVALGGLNASLRDYAKLGLLYLNKGTYNGKKILSEKWVEHAITPDAPHLMPNQTELSTNHFGYGYQWWTPQFPQNDFFAVGIYSQFVYVNMEKNLVIAKLSANYKFKEDTQLHKDKHVAMLQSIASGFPIPSSAF